MSESISKRPYKKKSKFEQDSFGMTHRCMLNCYSGSRVQLLIKIVVYHFSQLIIVEKRRRSCCWGMGATSSSSTASTSPSVISASDSRRTSELVDMDPNRPESRVLISELQNIIGTVRGLRPRPRPVPIPRPPAPPPPPRRTVSTIEMTRPQTCETTGSVLRANALDAKDIAPNLDANENVDDGKFVAQDSSASNRQVKAQNEW